MTFVTIVRITLLLEEALDFYFVAIISSNGSNYSVIL